MKDVTPASSRRIRNWLRVLVVLFFVGTIWFAWRRPDQWSFRHELPWGAQDVHEWHWSDGLLPDYAYHLKAKITEPEFKRYIAKFGLTPHTATRRYSEDILLQWSAFGPFNGDWWDPSDSLDGTYVWEHRGTWTFAKYERGRLYLSSIKH
jgi:hypothetical protein